MAEVAPPKKEKLPKGVGRVPGWWLEITPHDTLYLDEDEARRKSEMDEAELFARKAAEYDLMQKYGGEGFPNWNPAEDGPRTKEEQEEWISKGYQRSEATNQWSDSSGAPLEGRQFKGTAPPGYVPGQYGPGGLYDPAKFGGSALKSTAGYVQDEKKNWSKPDWMKVKLKSTGKGDAIRTHDPYSPTNKKIAKTTDATAEFTGNTPFKEDDEDAGEFHDIGSAATPAAALSPELQKIMERRAKKEAGDD